MQALVTLNDDQFVEAARHFAANPQRRQNFPRKLDFAFELATGRPADQLHRRAQKVLLEQSKVFKEGPKRADELPR